MQRSLKEIAERSASKKPVDDILGETTEILTSLLQFLSDYDK